MKILFFDIETDNLLRDLTTIHCTGLLTGSLEEVLGLDHSTGYDKLFRALEAADLVVGHNILGFDIPALGKLFGITVPIEKILDTLVLSRLVYPEMKDFDFSTQSDPVKYGLHALPPKYYGKHSLESWGFRLGNYKDDFGKDFTTYTPRMMEYCKQDVRVTKQLYYHLVKELYKWPSVKPTDKITDIPAVWLEMRVAEICQVQEANGFAIDVAKTQSLYDELKAKRDGLLVELQKVHPGWKVDMKTPESYAFDIGEVTFKDKSKAKVVDSAYKYAKEQGIKLTKKFIGDNLTVGPLHSKITTFNPKSHDHIAKLFMEKYDWKPTVFNEKDGKPTVNTSILQSLPYPECPLLIEFEVLQDRCEKLAEGKDGGYIKHAERDGRIHGGIITNGAVTSRATHMRPNLAQVPATGTPYGEEFRSLFIPRTGFKLVGSDADALELRGFAHYLHLFDKGRYTEAVDKGKKEDGTDIHTMNQKAAGLDTRDDAKLLIYSILYGAGYKKVMESLNVGEMKAKKLIKDFKKGMKGYWDLVNLVESQLERTGNSLKGLDGRKLFIRRNYAALNTLIQSAGAIICKRWMVEIWRLLKEAGLDSSVYQVAWIHDELQFEVLEKDVDTVKKICEDAMELVTYIYNVNCPLKANADSGSSWADTH